VEGNYSYCSTCLLFNLRGGIAIAENVSLNLALMNLLDRNYRVHGSGIDAPGVSLFIGLKFTF